MEHSALQIFYWRWHQIEGVKLWYIHKLKCLYNELITKISLDLDQLRERNHTDGLSQILSPCTLELIRGVMQKWSANPEPKYKYYNKINKNGYVTKVGLI